MRSAQSKDRVDAVIPAISIATSHIAKVPHVTLARKSVWPSMWRTEIVAEVLGRVCVLAGCGP